MKKTIIVLGVASLLSACAHQSGGQASGHWGYEGHEGPEHWGMLSPDYAMCSQGKAQSPINITGAEKGGLSPIKFNYHAASSPEVLNNGHTIQVNYPAGSSAIIGGKTYQLLQFHFHAPSENQIDGEHADMVAHLVHKAEDGQLAVVAVLFDKGELNSTLGPVWSAMPKSKGSARADGPIDINNLLPADRAHYHFSGSLTTPPCSEGVNWNVLKARANVSQAQLDAFISIHPETIRPVQPLNGRMIKEL